MLKRRLWQRILPPQARGSHRRRNYHMDGATTLKYVRLRSIDSDRNRTQRQRNVLNVIIGKAKSMGISEGLELLNEILPLVKTEYEQIHESFHRQPMTNVAISNGISRRIRYRIPIQDLSM